MLRYRASTVTCDIDDEMANFFALFVSFAEKLFHSFSTKNEMAINIEAAASILSYERSFVEYLRKEWKPAEQTCIKSVNISMFDFQKRRMNARQYKSDTQISIFPREKKPLLLVRGEKFRYFIVYHCFFA